MQNIWLSVCRRMLVTLLALGAPMSGYVAAQAQTPTLGELAKKEQERRKGQKTPAKVYTKKDLPPSPPAAPPSGGSSATAAPADETKPAEKKPAEDE